MNQRSDLLNYIIDKRKCESYLEIGIDDASNFAKIVGASLKTRIGVDPLIGPCVSFVMSSDDFFAQFGKAFKFDLVFIDGLHFSQQVYKDILNSISCLRENGVVVMHDMLPQKEEHQIQKPWKHGDGVWNGDCWKAFAKYASTSPFKCYTLDFDYGLGVIDTSKPNNHRTTVSKSLEELTWADFVEHRDDWMNVKSKEHVFLEFGELKQA